MPPPTILNIQAADSVTASTTPVEAPPSYETASSTTGPTGQIGATSVAIAPIPLEHQRALRFRQSVCTRGNKALLTAIVFVSAVYLLMVGLAAAVVYGEKYESFKTTNVNQRNQDLYELKLARCASYFGDSISNPGFNAGKMSDEVLVSNMLPLGSTIVGAVVGVFAYCFFKNTQRNYREWLEDHAVLPMTEIQSTHSSTHNTSAPPPAYSESNI